MRELIANSSARFHLQDGRPLVFHAVRRSFVRRLAGEILLLFLVAVIGFVAANLFARSRPDGRAPGATITAASAR
jgi:hypothetical protein